MAVARCGNTGVTVGSEWCGLCRTHGCEGYKSYKQRSQKLINTVYIVLVEDSFSREFIIDTVFRKKKTAEDYIIKQCAKTGNSEDNYKIEEQVVY